jgi:hypothetical protein
MVSGLPSLATFWIKLKPQSQMIVDLDHAGVVDLVIADLGDQVERQGSLGSAGFRGGRPCPGSSCQAEETAQGVVFQGLGSSCMVGLPS